MKNGNGRPWPLLLIAAPAAVAIWSGWVGLGGMCGFGPVNLLPGIAGGFTLNTAITLPVGVEAYAAFALGAWMAPSSPEPARRFARWSALGALAYGMGGQVIYHLLAAAQVSPAPWPVVVVVSCMPVAVLGFAAALTHLLRGADAAGERTPQGAAPGSPAARPVSAGVSLPGPREIQRRRKCSPTTAKKIRAELELLVKAFPGSPAGSPTLTAGAAGRDDGSPRRLPAAPGSNGQAHG